MFAACYDAFVVALSMAELGFERSEAERQAVLATIRAIFSSYICTATQSPAAYTSLRLVSIHSQRALSAGRNTCHRAQLAIGLHFYRNENKVACRQEVLGASDAELAQNAEMLITMGCGDECPYVPGLRRDDCPLPDPKGQEIESVGQTRDEIR
jgi:hypothetical protein